MIAKPRKSQLSDRPADRASDVTRTQSHAHVVYVPHSHDHHHLHSQPGSGQRVCFVSVQVAHSRAAAHRSRDAVGWDFFSFYYYYFLSSLPVGLPAHTFTEILWKNFKKTRHTHAEDAEEKVNNTRTATFPVAAAAAASPDTPKALCVCIQ